MNNNGSAHQTPNRIIVHCMAEHLYHNGRWTHAPDFITDIGLSAHAYVTPNGEIIRQREDDQGAWHAKGFNTNSLGVEILVEGYWDYANWLKRIEKPWCGNAQFISTVNLCKQWCDKWSIDRIDRHSDVDPDRKKDPGGGFQWEMFKEQVGI